MLLPLLARVIDPCAGVAVCGAPLAGGPCRSVFMHAPAGGDDVRRASGGGASSSAGRGHSADSEWSELLDCLRAYQADTTDTPGTPGTPGAPDTAGVCFTVPTRFVVPSRAPYARCSWGDALGKRVSRLASQARQGTLKSHRCCDLEAVRG